MTPVLANTPRIETERLILRAPLPARPARLRRLRSPRHARPSCARARLTNGKTWRAFGHIIGHWVLRGFGQFVFADRATGAALGMCGPWFPAGWPEPEVGWTIWAPEAEGRGYAFEAASAARDHAFRALGWQTAVSYIDPDNARSIALAARLGAVLDDGAAHPGTEPCLVFRHPSAGEPAVSLLHSSWPKYLGVARSARHRLQGPMDDGQRPGPAPPPHAPEARMSDPTALAAALLKEHRASIDRLDAILVYTLAERFKHTQAVGRLKAEHDLPPSDPAREADADRPARTARRRGRPRPGIRPQVPELRHQRSDQASRETAEITQG